MSSALTLFVDELQRFVGQVAFMPTVDELLLAVTTIGTNVSLPVSTECRLALSMISARVTEQLVAAFHVPGATACECRPPRLIQPPTPADAVRSPFGAFVVSVQEFVERYKGVHATCLACSAARTIRMAPANTWRAETVAAALDTTPYLLRTSFGRVYGMKVSDYILLCRLILATELLTANNTKISAVSQEAGFRSPKDLYLGLSVWCGGVRPSEFRRLPCEAQAATVEKLRALTVRRCVGGGHIALRSADLTEVCNSEKPSSSEPLWKRRPSVRCRPGSNRS